MSHFFILLEWCYRVCQRQGSVAFVARLAEQVHNSKFSFFSILQHPLIHVEPIGFPRSFKDVIDLKLPLGTAFRALPAESFDQLAADRVSSANLVRFH